MFPATIMSAIRITLYKYFRVQGSSTHNNWIDVCASFYARGVCGFLGIYLSYHQHWIELPG